MIAWTTVEDAIETWVRSGSGLSSGKVIWAQQGGPRPTGAWISLLIASVRSVGRDWVNVIDNPLTVSDTVESVDTTANTLTLTAHGLLTGDGPIRYNSTGTYPGGLAVDTDYWIIKVDANTVKLAASFPNAMNNSPIDITSTGSGTHTIASTTDTVRAAQEIINRVRGQREVTLSIQAFAGVDGAATGSSSPRALLDLVVAGARLPTAESALYTAGVGVAGLGPVQAIDGVLGSAVFEPRATLEARLLLASEVEELGTIIDYIELENETTGGATQYVPEDPTP